MYTFAIFLLYFSFHFALVRCRPLQQQFEYYLMKHRLVHLKLDSLHVRRIKQDMIMCYKIINGLVALNCSDFFSFNYVRTRGHNFKLYLPECRLDARKLEFASRGTIYHLMLSTLSAWTHSSVNWLMFVLYVNVCRLFVFVSVFGHVSVFWNLSTSFFSFRCFFCLLFFVFVSANEMHSQLLVGACCVCICLYAYWKSIIYKFFVSMGHELVFCLGTCVSCWMSFCRPINHSFIRRCVIAVIAVLVC